MLCTLTQLLLYYYRKNRKTNWLLGFSLALNLVLLVAAFGIAFHYREKLLQIYLEWRGKADIVFFGDSITAQGDWNTLLDRRDIKNSGVPGLGVFHLKEEIEEKVLSYRPQLCVVMGGINDLTILERTALQTIADYKEILSTLRESKVNTLVQMTLYERENPAIKMKVDSLNSWLSAYCDSIGIPTVDPNTWLSDQNGLQKDFARDRTHLTKKAYQVWAEGLKPVIEENLP